MRKSKPSVGITGKLEILYRLPNSANGNPRYQCKIGEFECRTKPDSSLAYILPNHRGEKVKAYVSIYYGYRTVESIEPCL